MANLPSGTLTFLFTDIEGSTRLWETQRAEMQTALARHDALLRHAVTAHCGHVFKTVGDAICAVFPTASDAVAAALSAQRSLRVEPWPASLRLKVRMALHTGAAELRVQVTLFYCREDNTGVCRIRTLVWRVPVEVSGDATAVSEIKIEGRLKAE